MKKFLGLLDYIISQFRIHVSAFLKGALPLAERFPQFEIGRGCYGPLKVLTFGDSATLRMGAFCAIGPGTQILLGGEHNPRSVSMYPFEVKYFPRRRELPRSHFSKGDVVIGNDVWVGADSMILSGAQIGDGAIVGARSLVSGIIPPYAIAVGSPAKVIKYRFAPEVIEQLLAIKWWNWPDSKIDEARHLLLGEDIEAFYSYAREHSSNL